ncbi:hypothetical protein HDE_09373 [Halotydeus destructor]|nr:hypothetical protein HDE_09373 [Halotydeus destructor]
MQFRFESPDRHSTDIMAADPVVYVDSLLFLLGIKLEIGSKFTQTINWIAFVFALIYVLADSVFSTLFQPKSFALLTKLRYVSQCSCPLITMMYVKYNRVKMAALVRSTVNSLDHVSKRYLVKLSLIGVILYLIFVLRVLYRHVYYFTIAEFYDEVRLFTNASDQITWYQLFYGVLDLFVSYFFTRQWLLITTHFYVFTFVAISCMQLNFLQRLSLNHEDSAAFYRQMTTRWRKLNTLKSDFNDLFGVFPVLWFSNILLKSSGVIINASFVNDSFYVMVWQILVLQVIVIFTALVIIVLVQNRISMQVDEYIGTKLLTSSLNDISKIFFADELHRKPCMTALSMFELNGSLVVGYLGSLITFTVLFIQISHA